MAKYLNFSFLNPDILCIVLHCFCNEKQCEFDEKETFSPWKIKETEQGRLKIINEKKWKKA